MGDEVLSNHPLLTGLCPKLLKVLKNVKQIQVNSFFIESFTLNYCSCKHKANVNIHLSFPLVLFIRSKSLC